MTITLSWATLIVLASGITAIGAAWKTIREAQKALNKPKEELENKLKHYDECLTKDKKRLDEIEKSLELEKKDNEVVLKTLKEIIKHLRTKNNTDAMKEVEDNIDNYLIERK